jgi:hypothetical protein
MCYIDGQKNKYSIQENTYIAYEFRCEGLVVMPHQYMDLHTHSEDGGHIEYGVAYFGYKVPTCHSAV